MTTANILITGANRGIGRVFVEAYLAKPHHTVIAAVRDPAHPTAKSFPEISTKGAGSRLIIVKIDASVEADAAAAVGHLTADEADLLAHFMPNVLGIVYLYQATRALLLKAAEPKWVTIGSNAGCIEAPISDAAYGPTNAAVHWLTKHINAEDDTITAFVIHPAWAQTGIGNLGASLFGQEEAPLPVEESVGGMIPIIKKAIKEATAGTFWDHTGKTLAW